MRHRVGLLTAALAVGVLLCTSGTTMAAPCPGQQCWNGTMCVSPINATLTAPSITCVSSTGSSITLRICGTGTYGAPAGFSIQMKSKAEFDAEWAANPGAPCENRGWSQSSTYAAWSLSGQCPTSPWALGPGQCVDVVIDADFVTRYMDNPATGMCGASGPGVVLQCGTEYIFRVFAHNLTDNQACPKLSLNASPKGPTTNCVTGVVCATAACPPDGGCTLTWGYWKTHGPDDLGCSPGNQENDWDLTEFPMKSTTLSQAQVCNIFKTSPGGSACGKGFGANAVIILEHQLFAAMLNVANGAVTCVFATDAIADAKDLLDGKEFDCVGVSTSLGQQMIEVKDRLAAYNNHICECPVPSGKPQPVPGAATKPKSSSWGEVKVLYR